MQRSLAVDAGFVKRWRVLVIAVAGAAVLAVLAGQLCCFTVGAAQYALVTEFGNPLQIIKSPGLSFKYPWQSVHTFDNRLFAYTSSSSEFLTFEKTPVIAASTIVWRIADPKRFFETVFDRIGAESRLGDVLFAELGAAIGRSPLSTFVALDPTAYRADAVLAEVARKCRAAALQDYGIGVVDVQLQSFDFPKQNRLRVYARMKSERGRLSMRYRSEGEEAGLRVRATGEEEKSRILSRATETAQQHRGEGESEAARIYAQGLGAAPDFYRFLQTMEASRSFVHKGTTIVLPADSELFGVLYNSNYYSHDGASDPPRRIGANPKQEEPATTQQD